jgi:predicted phosphodiesterase
MKTIKLTVIIVIALIITTSGEQIGKVERKTMTFLTAPYLQNPAPDAMTVMWITSENSHSWIEYGENGILTERAESEINGLIVANNRLNKIRLADLKPNTRYAYKVLSREILDFAPYKVTYGDTIQSKIYSFVTPDIHQEDVSLLILNDVHNQPAIFDKLLALNNEKEFDFVVLNGDIINYVTGEAQIISNVIEPVTRNFASEKPFMYVRGNHETRGVYARNFYDYVDNSGSFYSLLWGPAFFIFMDTGEDKTDDQVEYSGLVAFDNYRKRQAIWLEQQLKSDAAQKAEFRVVFMHIPHHYSGDGHGVTHCRELFGTLFNKYNVDISVSGHTHKYGVYPPLNNVHDFPMIIGGGSKNGTRTLIRMDVNTEMLSVSILNESGVEVGKYNLIR